MFLATEFVTPRPHLGILVSWLWALEWRPQAALLDVMEELGWQSALPPLQSVLACAIYH